MAPVSKLIANTTLSLEKNLPKPDNKMTAQDLKTMAKMGEKEGSIKVDEREIIENVIEFGNTTVREIMTSRVNIVAVSVEYSLPEVIELIQDKGLSRMPLYEIDLDNILGVIYSKDVLPYINTDLVNSGINWKTIARKALFIPATKKLDDLLRDFQHEKTHIAIVVDEYGGTEGIVTLDDILEEIVGDIGDEYDETEEKLYTKFKSGVYIFDAKIDLDDLDEIMNTSISGNDDEFETLGGLVYHLTERIPNVGERVNYKNLELTVHSVKNNRVKKLRVKKIPPKQENILK
jgi:CBS domain containing-hemolysin-like protein